MFTYPDLELAIHAELKNLKGFSATDAEAVYTTPLTVANLLMPDYPLTRVRRQAIASVAEIARAICETDKHPDRLAFHVDEGPITQARGGVVLQASLGPYGSVRDADTGQELGRNTLQALNRMLDPDLVGVYDAADHAYFCIQGQRLWFVSPSGTARYERFVFEMPGLSVFTWTTEDAKTPTPLSADYLTLALSGAVRILAQKTDAALAQMHDANFAQGLQLIKMGTSYKPVALPAYPKQ